MNSPLALQPETSIFEPADLPDALPFAVLVINKKGCIEYVNPAAEEFIGVSAHKLLEKPAQSIVYLDNVLSLIAKVRHEKAMVSERKLRLEQFQKQADVHATALYLNEYDAVMLLLQPISQAEIRAEEDTRERITAASSLMAAMLAHEIKNPLAGIRGAAQLLGMEAGEENTALSTLICTEVDRIRDMVERIERLSGDMKNSLEPLNVHEVLRYACTLAQAGAARKQTISIEEYFDPSLPNLMADRQGLIQLFLNLLKNSMEALANHANPVITLKTTIAHGFAHSAAIEISDNGSGIPAHMLQTLFEPFSSTRGQGRGLGLAISAQLAACMGGKLEYMRDKSKQGACFRVLLHLVRNLESPPLACGRGLEGGC